MPIRFDHPELLTLLLLGIPVAWLGMRSLVSLDPARKWTAIAVRLLVLLILTFMLAGMQAVRTHDGLTVVAVVDRSESVTRYAQPRDDTYSLDEWISQWLRQASKDHRPDDRLGVVSFDGRPTVRVMPSSAIDVESSIVDEPLDGTDIGQGIRLSMAIFEPDASKRIVLISDGNDTSTGGDLRTAAMEAAAAGVSIDVLPLEYAVQNEVMVERLYAPVEARQGQTVSLRVVLRATRRAAGVLHVLHDGAPIKLADGGTAGDTPVSLDDWSYEAADDDVPANGGRYVLVRLVNVELPVTGVNRFRAVFDPTEGDDAHAVNNQAEAFTLVHGKGRLLLLDNVGGESGRILANALEYRGFDMDVVAAGSLPTTISQLSRYDAVLLHNVPAEMVPPAQQEVLSRYITDMGGGMVMIGGPDSFGAGGWTNSAIDRILPVTCEVPSQIIAPVGALVLVIDRSGSMSAGVGGTNRTQQQIANEAAALAVRTLYPDDMVGVVAFDDTVHWPVPLAKNPDRQDVMKRIMAITPAGGTSIYPALEAAQAALAPLTDKQAAVKHVLLLTDGQSNQGEWDKVTGMMRTRGITLSTVAVGDGADVQLLDKLARQGGGKFYHVTNPNDLPYIFVKEARTIRKHLIKETPFVPTIRAGSPIIAGITGTPALKGFVVTGERKDPRVFTPMLGPDGAPLFAHWQVGLGRTAAFTSDATNRWAADWLPWGGYGDFWARTIRAVGRPAASRDFEVASEFKGDQLAIRLDATADQRKDTGFLNIRGTVLPPAGDPIGVTLTQTGPGVYEALVPAPAHGSYVVSLMVADRAGERRYVVDGATRFGGAEMRQFQSNRAALEEVAAITGGRVLDPTTPAKATLFERGDSLRPSRSIRPMWRVLLMWLVPLLLLDVAVRRIAWSAASLARFFSPAPREVADTRKTLSALKQRTSVVQAKASVAGVTKFEAPIHTEVAGNFADAVGAAKPSEPKETPRPKAEPEAGVTGRLLDAKRRARQRFNEDGN